MLQCSAAGASKMAVMQDPRDANVVLEVGDKIDASTTTEEQKRLDWSNAA